MFGSSSSSSQSESSISSYIFQEESACAKLCPNLTYSQRLNIKFNNNNNNNNNNNILSEF